MGHKIDPQVPRHHSNTESTKCAGCLGAALQRAEGGAQPTKAKHHPKAKAK